MRRERLEDIGIDGGIFDWRVGPNERRRIFPLGRIGRRIGDEITVAVTIVGVELPAIGASVLRPMPERQSKPTRT